MRQGGGRASRGRQARPLAPPLRARLVAAGSISEEKSALRRAGPSPRWARRLGSKPCSIRVQGVRSNPSGRAHFARFSASVSSQAEIQMTPSSRRCQTIQLRPSARAVSKVTWRRPRLWNSTRQCRTGTRIRQLHMIAQVSSMRQGYSRGRGEGDFYISSP